MDSGIVGGGPQQPTAFDQGSRQGYQLGHVVLDTPTLLFLADARTGWVQNDQVVPFSPLSQTTQPIKTYKLEQKEQQQKNVA